MIGDNGYDYQTCPECGSGMWNGCCENVDCKYHYYPLDDEEDEDEENE